MKQLNNKKGFSLIFAMGIVLSISLTTIYLLEYVLPFAKDTKGIEFSTNAYYQSSSAIEEGLFFVARNELGDEDNDSLSLESSDGIAQREDYGYDIEARGNTIPPAGEGNSIYDPYWNMLSPGKPLQIEIGDSWGNADIVLRVPDTGVGENISLEPKTGGIIGWQLSSNSNSLTSEGENDRIGEDLLKSGSIKEFHIEGMDGKTLEGNIESFDNFYTTNCNTTNDKCTLKLSIINELILANTQKTPIPFIEYQVTGLNDAPLRYTRINTEGYSTAFKKDRDIKVPQQTVNEAFDFTIFQ